VLRYIAGGIVVILIGVMVAVLLVNRRREAQGVRYDRGVLRDCEGRVMRQSATTQRRSHGWLIRGLFALLATISCLAWGLPASAQASSPPSVFGESVSHITEHNATLEASINPNGLKTTYQFRLESGCLPPLVCLAIATYPLPSGEIPASSEAHQVTLDLNSAGVTLRPDTKYRYSVEAASSAGTNESPSHYFTTAPASAPSIESESASNITPTDATLQAQINAEGLETTYEVWVGALPCVVEFGGLERCEEDKVVGSIPAGFSAQQVSVDIAKASHQLKPNSPYLYSFRATNMDGTTYGANNEFKTAAESPPVINSVSVSHLTPTDATLEGQINSEGLSTMYEFRLTYTRCRECMSPTYNIPLLSGLLLASFQDQSVSVDLNSVGVTLKPGFYEYSLSATSTSGSTEAPGGTFEPPLGVLDPPSPGVSPLSGAGQSSASNSNSNDQPAGPGSSSSTPGVQSPDLQVGKTTKLEPLTSSQKLTKALKVCDKKPKKQRPSCKRQAEKKYAAPSKHRA
jgi:hypothetical protein